MGDYTLLPPRILAEPRNIQFRQWGPWTFLFLLLLWFLLPIIWILSESPVILSSHDISLNLLSQHKSRQQIRGFSDFTSIFYTFSNEKTSTKSFGLDSQGRGFRTEFTKTWRWIIRHGHQTHHVRPKGNENPPIEKHQGVSPWSPWHLTLDASATRSKVQGSFWLSAMPCCTTLIMGNSQV